MSHPHAEPSLPTTKPQDHIHLHSLACSRPSINVMCLGEHTLSSHQIAMVTSHHYVPIPPSCLLPQLGSFHIGRRTTYVQERGHFFLYKMKKGGGNKERTRRPYGCPRRKTFELSPKDLDSLHWLLTTHYHKETTKTSRPRPSVHPAAKQSTNANQAGPCPLFVAKSLSTTPRPLLHQMSMRALVSRSKLVQHRTRH